MNEELKNIVDHLERGLALLKAHIAPGKVDGQVNPITPYQEYPKAVTHNGETRVVGGPAEEREFMGDSVADEPVTDEGHLLPPPVAEPEPPEPVLPSPPHKLEPYETPDPNEAANDPTTHPDGEGTKE